MKRLICAVFVCLFLSTLPVLTLAASPYAVNVTVNGRAVAFTADTGTPFVDEASRTQVPLRATMEAFGCLVSWDVGAKTVSLTKGATTVLVPIGVNHILINGIMVTTDTAACIVSDRTYLPIRAVAEAFSAQVHWNQDTRTVQVNPTSRQINRSYYAFYHDLLDHMRSNPASYYEDPYGNLSDNQVAFADINGDGIDDLFVRFLDASAAASYTGVYTCDPSSGDLYLMGTLAFSLLKMNQIKALGRPLGPIRFLGFQMTPSMILHTFLPGSPASPTMIICPFPTPWIKTRMAFSTSKVT